MSRRLWLSLGAGEAHAVDLQVCLESRPSLIEHRHAIDRRGVRNGPRVLRRQPPSGDVGDVRTDDGVDGLDVDAERSGPDGDHGQRRRC